jgi:hypothetical protein
VDIADSAIKRPNNLLKEIPDQTEANHEIVVGIIWCGIEVVSRHCSVKMFGFEVDSGSLNSGIYKKVDVWKVTDLFLILNKKFA